MTNPSPLHQLFTQLDTWRNFPAYQLERRLDAIIAVYLPRALEEHVGVALAGPLIPEFPLKTEESRQSKKVDFVGLSADRERLLLIELKTDPRSRRIEQDAYLADALRAEVPRLVEDVRDIALASQQKHKYSHLLHALAGPGLLALPDDLAAFLHPKPRRGASDRLAAIRALPCKAKPEIVFVQPEATEGDASISFEQLARTVEGFGDQLSALLAAHLRAWTEAAGAQVP